MTDRIIVDNLNLLEKGLRDDLRRFLDQVGNNSPFQDPYFSGNGGFGGGLAEHYFILRKNRQIVMFGYGIENYALGRFIPTVRSLVFPKGPVILELCHLENSIQFIKEYAKKVGLVDVKIQPQWTNSDSEVFCEQAIDLGLRSSNPLNCVGSLRLSLLPNPEALMAGMQKTTRYEVRRADRLNIKVRFAENESDIKEFSVLHRDLQKQKKFNGPTIKSFSALMSRVIQYPNYGALLLGEINGEILGGAFLLKSGPTMFYVYGATTLKRDIRNLPISYPILWQAILWARQMGCSQFDFGGYDEKRGGGVARFKRGFGGNLIKTPVVFEIEMRPCLKLIEGRLKRLKQKWISM